MTVPDNPGSRDGVCFVDTETTGLDPDRHQIWEVGLILPNDDEYHWYLPVDLGTADPFALDIGRFHERHPHGYRSPTEGGLTDLDQFSEEFASLTYKLHMAGAVISFDDLRLAKLLRAHGQQPGWHYHVIDVEALAAGYLAAGYSDAGPGPHRPPWNSDELSQCLGVHPDQFERHTALGDSRWARAIYHKVLGP